MGFHALVAISTPKRLGMIEVSECLDSKQVKLFGPPCGEYEFKTSWMKAFQFFKDGDFESVSCHASA